MSWAMLHNERLKMRMGMERRVRKFRRIWWHLTEDLTPEQIFKWASFALATILLLFVLAVVLAQAAIALGRPS